MKHSSGAGSPVKGCLSLKHQPTQVMKKKAFFPPPSCVLSSPIWWLFCALLKEALLLVAQHVEGAACSWKICDGHQIKQNWILCDASERQYETKAINLAEWFLLIGGRIEGSRVKPSQTLLQLWWRALKTVIARAATGWNYFFLIIQDRSCSHFDRC